MKSSATFSLDERSIDQLVQQRTEFHAFLTRLTGNATDAEDILQEGLLRALQRGHSLRRGERATAWFYRILRNVAADHYRSKKARARRVAEIHQDLVASGDDVASPPAPWDAAVCRCFKGLLPLLKPRAAELITRVDLKGETKTTVRAELKLSAAAFDVALHRARQALRSRLELFCGACSRDACLACACAPDAGAA